MIRITIDEATRDKLRAAKEAVELVDENGELLGTFKPAGVPPYDASLIPPITLEELRRREQEQEAYSTEEVLQKLKHL